MDIMIRNVPPEMKAAIVAAAAQDDRTGLSTEQRQQVAAFVASLRGGGDRTVTETGGV